MEIIEGHEWHSEGIEGGEKKGLSSVECFWSYKVVTLECLMDIFIRKNVAI